MMKTWKMLVSGLLVALLAATAFTGQALARGPRDGGAGVRSKVDVGSAYGFVDEDGDGVNDRFGVCDGTPADNGETLGFGYGFGYGFVDEDGDGVNDRYGTSDGVPDYAGYGAQQGGRGRWNR
jgi:hypothetical protein